MKAAAPGRHTLLPPPSYPPTPPHSWFALFPNCAALRPPRACSRHGEQANAETLDRAGGAQIFSRANACAALRSGARVSRGGARAKSAALDIVPFFLSARAQWTQEADSPETARQAPAIASQGKHPCWTRARNPPIGPPMLCLLGQGGGAVQLAQILSRSASSHFSPRTGGPACARVCLPRRNTAVSAPCRTMREFILPRKADGPTRAWTADLSASSRTLWPTELLDRRQTSC